MIYNAALIHFNQCILNRYINPYCLIITALIKALKNSLFSKQFSKLGLNLRPSYKDYINQYRECLM